MTESSNPRATPWPVIMALISAGVMVAFQVGKAPAALPMLQQELGIGLVTAGWVVSILNLLAMVGGTAVGVICDRLGHRGGVVVGLVIAAVASGIGAAADGAGLLLATRAFEGLGLMVVAVSVPPLLARLATDRDRPMVVGLWGTFMPIGMAVVLLAAPMPGRRATTIHNRPPPSSRRPALASHSPRQPPAASTGGAANNTTAMPIGMKVPHKPTTMGRSRSVASRANSGGTDTATTISPSPSKALVAGQTLEVLATDPGSVADFKAFCESQGHRLLESDEEGGTFRYLIEKG